MMNVDITEIFTAIITIATSILTIIVIPYIKEKIDATKYQKVRTIVKTAVEAAEMIYSESGMGEEKKKYVQQYLAAKGFQYDQATIDVLIESSVCQLKEEL